MWLRLFVTLLLMQYLKAECDVCQVGKAACRSRNTFSMCLDGTFDESAKIHECPTDYVCTGEKFICYPKAEYKPICTPTIDYDAFCAEQGKIAAYANENDPTCTSFILCQTRSNGKYTSEIWDCEDESRPYFDINAKGCVATKPAYCK